MLPTAVLTALALVGCAENSKPETTTCVLSSECADDERCVDRGCTPVALIDGGSPELASPIVDGEPSAGHDDPAWVWQEIEEATSYEVRCADCGLSDWASVGTDTLWRASGLSEGSYAFEARACADGSCSAPGSFTTAVEFFVPHEGYDGYWNGVRRPLARTPTGHVTAIVAHNSYVDDQSTAIANRAETIVKVDEALLAGADIVEIDVKLVDGVLYVDHEDDAETERAQLIEILDHGDLISAGQPLYLEIKSTSEFGAVADAILETLDQRRAFASNGRPVIIRSLADDDAPLREIVARRDAFPLIASYVRTQSIIRRGTSSLGDYLDRLDAIASANIDGVAMFYDESSLLTKVGYARSLGLGINLGTLAYLNSHVALREVADALNSDLEIGVARRHIEDFSPFVFYDATDQELSDGTLDYFRDGDAAVAAVVTARAPATVTHARGEPMLGSSLRFDATQTQRLPFQDADAPVGGGYLVSAYVVFDDLSLSVGENQVIVSKAENGAFGLDLDRKSGQPAYLRYYVWAAGAYRIAQYPVSMLEEGRAYLVTGVFDGNGDTWLFVDNTPSGTRPGTFSGGISNTNVRITVGANPGAGDVFFDHFSGEIQTVTVTPFHE